jgi:HEAT repeat protein
MGRISFLLAACLLASGATGQAAEPDPDLTGSEAALRQAKVGTDGPSLLAFFRTRTLPDADRAKLAAAVRRLGDDSFAVRQQAAKELTHGGRFARPFLLAALKDADQEVARQAKDCLRAVGEGGANPDLEAAAARLLAARRPTGAVEALLDYLPFADEEVAEEALLPALATLGLKGGKAGPAFERALGDREPSRRAAAAHVLGRCAPGQREAVRRLLADPDARVRFYAASALIRTGDKAAVPALIALLGEGPGELAWRAEDLLWRAAGQGGPPATLEGVDALSRRKCRAAWEGWWKAHAATIDVAGVGPEEPARGLYLVAERNPFYGDVNRPQSDKGRIRACGRDGKSVWEFTTPDVPRDAHLLPGGRVLVAEETARRVTERDRQGKVLWQYATSENVVSCQRLPNGNTFVVTYGGLLEVNRAGNVVWSMKATDAGNGTFWHAQKLSNGDILCACPRHVLHLDSKGKVLRRIKPAGKADDNGSAELLPNGNYLVSQAQQKRVVEVDSSGKVLWQYPVEQPRWATRMPNGNTLVTGVLAKKLKTVRVSTVAEVDRAGTVVWSLESKEGAWRIRRY